jgi:trigger factor
MADITLPTPKRYPVSITRKPGSLVEITATISATEFDSVRPQAIKNLNEVVKIDGFRPGMIPEKVLVAKVGEGAILEEMAEIAIGLAYPEILREEAIDAIGRPEIRVTKLAPGNPLEFIATTPIFPVFDLPDHKAIARTVNTTKETITVTEGEVQKAIDEIRTMKARADREGDAEHQHDEATEHDHGSAANAEDPALPLPELTDEFVKTLGDFANVAAFTEKVRESIHSQKERETRDKKRVAILDAILAKTTIDLPEIIVAQELERMEDEFSHDIARMGLDLDAYRKAVKKTREEMFAEWKPDAEKRAKTELLIAAIAKKDGVTPDPDARARDIDAVRTRFPDAPLERVEGYVDTVLTNEAVLRMLEETA